MSFLIASFPETEEIGRKVASSLKSKYSKIILKRFPDGESLVNMEMSPEGKILVIISSLAIEPNKRLIETVLAAGIGKDQKAKRVILIATYLPYMRQDKMFSPYESVAAHHIIKTLSTHFDKMYVIDPHLHRISSLKDIAKNCQEITSAGLIAKFIKDNFKGEFTIVGPDEESQQWGKRIADLLNVKSITLKKTRFSSEKVKVTDKSLGKNVLIIDDIISTGHTIFETIKIAKKHKAEKINCIAVHGLFINNSDKVLKRYASVFVTNTVPNKLSKIDVSPLIVETLNKEQNGQ